MIILLFSPPNTSRRPSDGSISSSSWLKVHHLSLRDFLPLQSPSSGTTSSHYNRVWEGVARSPSVFLRGEGLPRERGLSICMVFCETEPSFWCSVILVTTAGSSDSFSFSSKPINHFLMFYWSWKGLSWARKSEK